MGHDVQTDTHRPRETLNKTHKEEVNSQTDSGNDGQAKPDFNNYTCSLCAEMSVCLVLVDQTNLKDL